MTNLAYNPGGAIYTKPMSKHASFEGCQRRKPRKARLLLLAFSSLMLLCVYACISLSHYIRERIF